MKIFRKIVFFVLIPPLYVILTLISLGRSKKLRGEMRQDVWYEIYLDGVVNSKGKASPIFFRRGAEKKLMVFFSGGGVSWSEESAARPMSIPAMMISKVTFYTPKVYRFMRVLMTGLLATKPENPFKDWNVMFVPYVTGDFHLGNNEFEYKGGKKTLYHVGERNLRIAMEKCKELFPEAEKLLVCGVSAGAFGAAGNVPLVAGYYSDAPVTVYSDASQIVVPIWRKAANEVWRINEKLAPMVEEGGDLYFNLVDYSSGELGDRAVFLRSNTHYDNVLIEFGSTLHGGPHEATSEAKEQFFDNLIKTEKRLSESGLQYYSFVTAHNKNEKTGLTQHTMCNASKSLYFTGDVGVSLSQWLADAVVGKYSNVGSFE